MVGLKAPHGARTWLNACGREWDTRMFMQDLPRTFPNNIWAPTAEAEAKLRRILAAFSVHAPSIGYCQGMNYLTAMLLMVLAKDESKAFWVLVALLGEKGETVTASTKHI